MNHLPACPTNCPCHCGCCPACCACPIWCTVDERVKRAAKLTTAAIKEAADLEVTQQNRIFSLLLMILSILLFIFEISRPDPFNTGFWIAFVVILPAFITPFAVGTMANFILAVYEIFMATLCLVMFIQMAITMENVINYGTFWFILFTIFVLIAQVIVLFRRVRFCRPRELEDYEKSYVGSESENADYYDLKPLSDENPFQITKQPFFDEKRFKKTVSDDSSDNGNEYDEAQTLSSSAEA